MTKPLRFWICPIHGRVHDPQFTMIGGLGVVVCNWYGCVQSCSLEEVVPYDGPVTCSIEIGDAGAPPTSDYVPTITIKAERDLLDSTDSHDSGTDASRARGRDADP